MYRIIKKELAMPVCDDSFLIDDEKEDIFISIRDADENGISFDILDFTGRKLIFLTKEKAKELAEKILEMTNEDIR